MQEHITAYLAQKKHCNLPGIGRVVLDWKKAAFDVADKQFLPPSPLVTFELADVQDDDDFIRYLSDRANVSTGFATGEFEKWSSQATAALENNNDFFLRTSLQFKNYRHE